MDSAFFEVGLAVTLFAGTNIDDVFVLLAFFSDKRFRVKEIVIGQYLGILALTLGSILLSFGAKQIPQSYIGLLGLVPLALGLKKLWDLVRQSAEEDSENLIAKDAFAQSAKLLSVAGVTMANGGDNLGVYVPLFSTKSAGSLILYLAVFLVMTAIWCAAALYLINHRQIGALLKRFGHYFIPWVFIGLGIYILYEAHTFELLRNL